MIPKTLRLGAAMGLVAATAILATLCLVALNAGGEARIGPVVAFRLAAGFTRPAERLLAAPSPTPARIAEAARLSRAALREFPYDNSAWLRLAYADTLQHGRLTPQGAALLRRSYDLVGVDIYAGVWRIAFTLENSQFVPKDLRKQARNEFEALWRDYDHRAQLKAMAQAIRNPAGRLTAALWLDRLERSPPN